MPAPAILAEGLVKTFGSVRALDGVDMAVEPGTVFGLLGPNGAGKTTTIRILSTLMLPESGSAQVGGFDVLNQPREVRRLIGLTGQYAAVDEQLSGAENLYMIGRLLGMSVKGAKARSAELLASFDLTDAAKKVVKAYSGGMRRRLDLAASLVGRPPFLYLDEPTTGLDPRSRVELWGMIRKLVADGATVLLTTQYLEEADRLCDEISVVDHGKVIASGTPLQLKSRIGSQVLAAQPENESDIPKTQQILGAFAGQGDEAYVEDGVVAVRVDDRSTLAQAIVKLDEAGIVVDDLSLRRPSLDEVFLTLTGHVAEEAPEPDDAFQPTPDEERSRA